MRATMPGVLKSQTLEDWKVGRLVGTVEEVRAQVDEWSDLGVSRIILSPGAVPFQTAAFDDVDLLARDS